MLGIGWSQMWVVHVCHRETFVSHPIEDREFGGMLSRFASSDYDYGSKQWLCSLKSWSGEEGHFLRILDPRGVSILLFNDWLLQASQFLPITMGYKNEPIFWIELMFQIVFPLFPQEL